MKAQRNTSLFFDFYGIGERSVRTNISKEMNKAITRALQFAKRVVNQVLNFIDKYFYYWSHRSRCMDHDGAGTPATRYWTKGD